MPDDILDLADRLWRGEADIRDHHPFGHAGSLAEVAPGVGFVPSFANVSALDTEEGLVLVDTGSPPLAESVHRQVREWSSKHLHTAVYSHGHVDHVFGVPVFEAEAEAKGWPGPRVVAHEALPARFDRYVLTAGYNEIVNQRQFQVPGLRWPTEYRYPQQTYRDRLDLEIGGLEIELHHARGETDDHTWTWVPQRRVLCCGDFFIWASPNAGNPQKVQRYPRDWAAALRQMAALGAEILLPGHGYPVIGERRVRQALSETADLLESLHDQTVELMNDGARLDDIVHSVSAPPQLIERPYLRPIYDEPEFVVRNTWRLYGGWYDGNPAHLKPAPEAALATELSNLAGGAARLATRAEELANQGAFRLAGHLVELAAQAEPEDKGVHRIRASVNRMRSDSETSTMSKGIFAWAAAESARRAEDPKPS